MKNFESADADDPYGIIKATQRAVLSAIEDAINNIKQDLQRDGNKVPGLTWEQLNYVIDGFKKKQPEIRIQEEM